MDLGVKAKSFKANDLEFKARNLSFKAKDFKKSVLKDNKDQEPNQGQLILPAMCVFKPEIPCTDFKYLYLKINFKAKNKFYK